jgi:hypothetical protein
MKKMLTISAAALLFFSCQKTGFNREQVRITQTKYNVGADSAEYFEFGYDPSGRVSQVKIGINLNNGTPVYTGSITYTGNQAVIRTTPVNNGNIYSSTEVHYTLNASALPVTRIQLDTFFVIQSDFPLQAQRTYKADTANYQYDADGLLLKVTGASRDSTWLDGSFPQTLQTQTAIGQWVTDYTNTGRNVSQIVQTGSQLSRTITPGQTIITPLHVTGMNKWTFQYTHSSFNLTDFNNAFIMMEYGVILNSALPLNKAYKNLPDKVTEESTVYDQQGLHLADSEDEMYFSYTHFPDGFISSVTKGSIPPPGGVLIKPIKVYLSYKK